MKIIIKGQPYAKARARTCKNGLKSVTYDPQNTEKQTIKWKLKNQSRCLPLQGDLQIKLDFFFKPSDSDSDKNLKMFGIIPHTQKPDLDNLEKFILDCANGILFNDDSQIVSIISNKHWSDNPRTEINIMKKEAEIVDEYHQKVLNLFSPSELLEMFADAKNLLVLSENGRNYPENFKKQWLEQSAVSLINFSHKYSEKMKKINKIVQDKKHKELLHV